MWLFKEYDGRFEVGFYRPDGGFTVIEIYDHAETAANRVHYLNGGSLSNWVRP